jgi:hypothetical protein
MDTQSIIIGAVILALCILPLAAGHISKKKKDNKIINALREFASLHSCGISVYDIWLNSIIGADENRRAVFFIKAQEGRTETMQHLWLEDVLECRVQVRRNGTAIEKIDLVISRKDTTEVRLEFYNVKTSIQLGDELQLAHKWETFIRQGILQKA